MTSESPQIQAALAAESALREATQRVLSMLPAVRDPAEVLGLLGTEDLRGGAMLSFTEDWAGRYDHNSRIEVLRRESKQLSETEVEIRTCERYWMNAVDVGDLNPAPEGKFGYVRSVSGVWRLQDDGRWRKVLYREDRDICHGLSTDGNP